MLRRHCVSRSTVPKEALWAQCLLHGGGHGSSVGEGTCRCGAQPPGPPAPQKHMWLSIFERLWREPSRSLLRRATETGCGSLVSP